MTRRDCLRLAAAPWFGAPDGPFGFSLVAGGRKLLPADCEGAGLGVRRAGDRLEITNLSAAPLELAEVNVARLAAGAGAVVDVERSEVTVRHVLVRDGSRGSLLALDFPCAELKREGDLLELGYRPHIVLRPGDTHVSHALLSSPIDLTREPPAPVLRRLFAARFPFPFDRPLHVCYPITNQWYYSPPNLKELAAETSPYRGDPGYPMIHTDPEGVMRRMRVARELGLTHFVLYPAFDRLPPGRTFAEQIREVVRYGHGLGLAMVGCAHFNAFTYWGFHLALGEDARALQALHKDEWFRRSEDGRKAAHLCTGCPEFVEWAASQAVEWVRNYELDAWLVDGAGVQACWASHGHPPGRDSLYAQVAGWAEYYRRALGARPRVAGMCNLGFDPLLPQAVAYLHSIYLTDPLNYALAPSLSDLAMLADSRRMQAVELLEKSGVPSEHNQNAEYYLVRDSPLRQEKTFEYSLLQGLAVSPNLSVADPEGLLDEIPARSRERAQAFWKRWTAFARDNFQALRQFRRVGEMPGFGRLEIYEKGDLLFIINPSPVPVPHELPLREAAEELYPAERWIPGGDRLYLEGAPNSMTLLRTGVAKPRQSGGEMVVEGRTGEEVLVYLASPVREVEVVPPAVKRAEGTVQAAIVADGAFRVRFPGRAAPEFISEWPQRLPSAAFYAAAREGRLDELEPGHRFLGVRLYNLPPVTERVRLRVLCDSSRPVVHRRPVRSMPEPGRFSGRGAAWRYEGRFYLPFTFSRAYRPGPEDHLLALPVLTAYDRLREARAWLNGAEITLEKHDYQRLARKRKDSWCYYLNLTKAGVRLGENTLAFSLVWQDA